MKYGQRYYTAASYDGQVLLAASGPIFCFGPDGKLRWHYNFDSGINSLACTGDGGLIAASYLRTVFLDGEGKLLRELKEKPNFFFTCTRQGRLAYGTWDGWPVSFGEKGQERWVESVYGRRAYGCACSPYGQVVAVVHAHMPYDDMQPQQEYDDIYVTCLNGSGKKLWMKYLGEGEGVSALAVGLAGDVWVGTSHHLYFFSGPKGTEWKMPMTESEREVMIPGSPPDEWEMPMDKESGVRALAIAAEGVIAGLYDGRVLRLSLGEPPGRHPSVLWDRKVESVLFQVSYDPVRDETWAAGRQLHCLGSDGAVLWQYDLGADVDSLSCAPGAGIVLVTSEDGKVHFIRDRTCFAAYYITGGRFREVSVTPSAIDALLQQLQHDDPALRRQAAEELGQRKEEEAAEALAHCLEDEEMAVREAAANALAAIGTPRAADLLLDALRRTMEGDEDATAYRSILSLAVALIDGPYVIEQLFQVLEEEIDEWVIEGLAEALGLMGGDEIADRLLQKMESGDWKYQDWTQRGALLALGRIGGERAVEAILPYLGHKDHNMRATAAYALSLSRDPRAFDLLVKCLRDKDDHARSGAVRGLASLGDRRAVGPLIAAFTDAEDWLRFEIAQALGQLGDPEAVEPLIQRLSKDKDEGVRLMAAEALGKLRDQRAVPALIAALHDHDKGVRWEAAEALGKLGDQRAVEPLTTCLQSKDSTLRSVAGKALEALEHTRGRK